MKGMNVMQNGKLWKNFTNQQLKNRKYKLATQKRVVLLEKVLKKQEGTRNFTNLFLISTRLLWNSSLLNKRLLSKSA